MHNMTSGGDKINYKDAVVSSILLFNDIKNRNMKRITWFLFGHKNGLSGENALNCLQTNAT